MVRGDVKIDEPVEMHGLYVGNVTVKAGGLLVLRGMVNGNLTVCRGAAARVAGMVRGDLIDEGGQVEVSGMVSGRTLAAGRSA
ncbi:MAG: hypothetical protein QM772_05855 [Ottowia sp.]|uniref:hypothetical protein n=1 Tax=Ottowia sp. TaxID=1898956 RepID=UPI0039E3F27E